MSQSHILGWLFHPIIVLSAALLAALIASLGVIKIFDGDFQNFLLYYDVPIGIPFVAFIFDRLEWWRNRRLLIDAPVIILALMRGLYTIPIISGHALFLTYALLTARSNVVRVTAVLVLLEVSYLKIFVWQDATLLGGIMVGVIAALIERRLTTNPPQ